MGRSELPRVNEVAAFLAEFAPDERERLLVAQPDLAPLLQLGVMGGEEQVERSAIAAGLIARASVLASALTVVSEKSALALATINARLSKARRFRFISSALSAIGSSAVIGAVFVSKAATIIAGTLALGSTLAGMFANTLALGREGAEEELTATARRLAKGAGAAELNQALLSALLKTDFDHGEMRELIEGGNALFEEINDALSAVNN